MVIQSQNIAMRGNRVFKQTSAVAYRQTKQPLTQISFADLAGRKQADRVQTTGDISSSNRDFASTNVRIQFDSLNYLFYLLFQKAQRNLQGSLGMNALQLTSGMSGFRVVSSEQLYTYEETETTTFSTQGKVVTADGREIDFNVDVGMSRSFYEEVYQKNVGLEPVMCDPLVINLDTDTANVSDQKFYFDLDCDGEEDEISMLGAGSAFLALDKNGDGQINDGSELFGTVSGNGFYDMSRYDLDGNGWIDEADEVFDRLQIWVPSEDGKGTCYKLKEKGVGAICLQNVSTDFSLRGQDQKLNGAIRRSGVFLMESGQAGTIQHVDLAM